MRPESFRRPKQQKLSEGFCQRKPQDPELSVIINHKIFRYKKKISQLMTWDVMKEKTKHVSGGPDLTDQRTRRRTCNGEDSD